MSRVAALLFLGVAACAHDHASNSPEVGAMKNASPAISPWPGSVTDPIAAGSADSPVTAVVDRVHEMGVQVVAVSRSKNIDVATGVLAGGGLVLTDLRVLLVETPGGGLQPAAEIAVLTTKGVFPGHLVGVASDAGVAVLELPEPARALEGAPLEKESPGSDDRLLALRASTQGRALLFDVIGFSMKPSEDALQLRSARGLPIDFAGAPVFDMRGALAGLLVGAGEGGMALVPAARLLEVLDDVHAPQPQADDHI